jgi:hypothetical protein
MSRIAFVESVMSAVQKQANVGFMRVLVRWSIRLVLKEDERRFVPWTT